MLRTKLAALGAVSVAAALTAVPADAAAVAAVPADAVATTATRAQTTLGPSIPSELFPTPGLITVTATSAVDSATAKSAQAHCPASHPMVYSAGGAVTDSLGQVTLTDAYPTADLTAVIAWGHENGPFAGSWSVSAYARCGPAADLQLVVATAASTSDPSKSVTAQCPAGTAVYGTGYELTGANGRVLPTAVRPNPALAKVTVAASASNGYALDWRLIAYAICGPQVAGMTRTQASSPVDETAPKTLAAPACPTGSQRTGGGAEVSPNYVPGYIGLTKLGGSDVDFAGGEPISGWWWYWVFGLTAYAICVP